MGKAGPESTGQTHQFDAFFVGTSTFGRLRSKSVPLSGSEPNKDFLVTSSNALPLSYRRLKGAKAIKLGSWDKHPAYTAVSVLFTGN